MNTSIEKIAFNDLSFSRDGFSYLLKFNNNNRVCFRAAVRIDGTGIHTTDKKYVELSIFTFDDSLFGVEKIAYTPKLANEQLKKVIEVSNQFLYTAKEQYPGIKDIRFDESYDTIINSFKPCNEFPNGSIKLVSVEGKTDIITEAEIEELETRHCTLCGMPFTVHPILEAKVVFCNFCTMHDIRSI